MSTQRQQVPIRDLVEEAKKRIVFLAICIIGLSYLMSLTSSSVWVNLPAAASLIVILRYLSLDYDMRRKAAAYNSRPSLASTTSQNKPIQWPNTSKKSEWRRKVNSPVVEEAIDHFTRHLVSEFVTDLWYSRLTPDRQGPEELACIVNNVLGEISGRMRNINLIDLLTRDLINLICTHLELFRMAQAKIEKQQSGLLTIEKRDMELRLVLAAENKLHPALFSAESEHKVLQHLMDGLISFTFKPEDLQCSLFRYIVRELLACAVMRPVLNLASPRFINERIELLVIKMTEAKGVTVVQEESRSKPEGPSKISSDHFSRFLDPSVTGVELVQLKNGQSRTSVETPVTENANGSKDPLLKVDTQSSRSWSSLPMNSQNSIERGIERNHLGGEWGDMLDLMSRRKTQALAPENFENMWAKGRNYKKKEGENPIIEQSSGGKSVTVDHIMEKSRPKDKEIISKPNLSERSTSHSGCTTQLKVENAFHLGAQNTPNHSPVASYQGDDERNHMRLEEVDSGSSTSYTSEDEETDSVTGLDSPGTKVWDGKSNRNMPLSHIHHPLENSERRITKRTGKGNLHFQRLPKAQSGQKRSRPSNKKVPVWQEVERTSFLSGDGQDILNSPKGHVNIEDSSDDSDIEGLGRVNSGAATSSSATSLSFAGSHSLTFNSLKNSMAVDSFFKLKCEVLGANIVKSDSKTFAVYSISVTDVNNNSWSIKRRFRHFEELHRHLKEFPEYNLHLPPKHFLSTGLDLAVIQERCILLDKYVKKLMQLPTVSGSIEVWDFLSVDSQTYVFTNSFSIIKTLSVNLDDKPSEKSKQVSNFGGPVTDPFSLKREPIGTRVKDSALQLKNNVVADGLRVNTKGSSPVKNSGNDFGKSLGATDSDTRGKKDASSLINLGKTIQGRDEKEIELFVDTDTDPTLPTEWVPPNLSVPILDLVDVIFQLQDGGWIRRKAFWVAKQILQLGMGDAFDDWLIEKIQLLRKGWVVASGIKRVEQILWPDGIFITKHPKRRPPSTNQVQNSPQGQKPTSSPRFDEQQKQEADRRAKLVYELMIDKAPAAIVGLVGSREYDKCAKDLYYFLQSSVCLKQLAYDLLELLLMSAFPELDYVFKQLHEEKHRFGTGKTLSIICSALQWVVDRRQQQKTEDRIESDRNGAKDGQVDSDDEPDWMRNAVINKYKQGEEMKTKKKEKFGVGFRRVDKRRNHENCRDLFSRSVEEEPCTKKEGNNLQMSNDAVELSDEDFLVEDYESEEEGNLGGGKLKRKVAGVSLSSSSEEDEEDGSGDDEYEEDEKLQVYFCSRTHSQLSQFIKELKKTVFANEMKVVCLGSRRNFCINEDVLKLGNSTRINERCLELQRNKNKEVSKIKSVGAGGRIRRNKASCGCPMLRKHKLQKEFRSMMSQQGALDIEDLVHLGKSMRTCPYYGSRSMAPVADLVVLPYQSLLSKASRESLGLNLKNNIVIIDEAHNLADSLISMYDSRITLLQLEDVHSHVEKYFERFCNVLGPGNRRYIQTFMVLTRAFRQVLLKDDRSYGDSCRDTEKASGASGTSTSSMAINDFLFSLNVDNINLVKLLQYIKESNIMHKVSGYGDKVASFQKNVALNGGEDGSTLSSFQALANLLLSLTNKDGDGRIIISRTSTTCSREEGRYIKYVMLTGDKIFSEIVDQAHSVVLAGGTLQPIEETRERLFPWLPPDQLQFFSCSHIVPPESILPVAVSRGPSGHTFDFSYSSRRSSIMIQELGQLLCNLVTVVPEGIVVFFSSFDYEGQVYDAWEASGILERIKKKKRLFREPRKNTYVESVLKEYKETIDTLSSGERKENPSQSGAMLLAVVGGKISEGINLSDGMGRCIVMVGLPYASPSDIELMERVKYIEGLGDSDSTKTPNLSLGNKLCSGEVHAGFNVLRSCRRRGKEYYENLCMKAVNQSIGRAIRHINDYAAILLVDTRYASDSSKRNFCHPTSKLPQWIKDRFVASTDYGEVHRMLHQFFKHNKKRWLQQ